MQGRVNVSYGLLTELRVNDKYGPGELAAASPAYKAEIVVKGPSWVTADVVELYKNGELVKSWPIADGAGGGVKWRGAVDVESTHDVNLVAIARGPGVDGLYWKTAKPYQPDSPDWEARVIGVSGAVWLDVDGDGRRTPAFDYARRIVGGDADMASVLKQTANYDAAVATHVAGLLAKGGVDLRSVNWRGAAARVREGFDRYLRAVRDTELAR